MKRKLLILFLAVFPILLMGQERIELPYVLPQEFCQIVSDEVHGFPTYVLTDYNKQKAAISATYMKQNNTPLCLLVFTSPLLSVTEVAEGAKVEFKTKESIIESKIAQKGGLVCTIPISAMKKLALDDLVEIVVYTNKYVYAFQFDGFETISASYCIAKLWEGLIERGMLKYADENEKMRERTIVLSRKLKLDSQILNMEGRVLLN